MIKPERGEADYIISSDPAIMRREEKFHREDQHIMVNPEFLDESVAVSARMGSEGEISPESLTWQDRQYMITAVGRQWDEADGRHVLVETGDGTRFELQLRREDLVWHIRRVWWASTLA